MVKQKGKKGKGKGKGTAKDVEQDATPVPPAPTATSEPAAEGKDAVGPSSQADKKKGKAPSCVSAPAARRPSRRGPKLLDRHFRAKRAYQLRRNLDEDAEETLMKLDYFHEQDLVILDTQIERTLLMASASPGVVDMDKSLGPSMTLVARRIMHKLAYLNDLLGQRIKQLRSWKRDKVFPYESGEAAPLTMLECMGNVQPDDPLPESSSGAQSTAKSCGLGPAFDATLATFCELAAAAAADVRNFDSPPRDPTTSEPDPVPDLTAPGSSCTFFSVPVPRSWPQRVKQAMAREEFLTYQNEATRRDYSTIREVVRPLVFKMSNSEMISPTVFQVAAETAHTQPLMQQYEYLRNEQVAMVICWARANNRIARFLNTEKPAMSEELFELMGTIAKRHSSNLWVLTDPNNETLATNCPTLGQLFQQATWIREKNDASASGTIAKTARR
ncbi:MAG: hypothetical protein M1838_004417 [Thelocarpon superellum]|nr:MAG: hypothetical protein M1838_004417 [Thelocarpon superellum]